MRSLLLLIALLPAVAGAQDSVTVAVPADKNCSDFDTVLQAQGHYLRMQDLTGQADAHRLDADGNGIACESIQDVRRIQSTGSSHYTTRERVHRLTCADTTITLPDYHSEVRGAFREEGKHTELHTMWDCVDLHTTIQQNQ